MYANEVAELNKKKREAGDAVYASIGVSDIEVHPLFVSRSNSFNVVFTELGRNCTESIMLSEYRNLPVNNYIYLTSEYETPHFFEAISQYRKAQSDYAAITYTKQNLNDEVSGWPMR